MPGVVVEALRRDPTDLLEHVPEGADIIVPLAIGEPSALLATLDEYSHRLKGVRVHQMHALSDLGYYVNELAIADVLLRHPQVTSALIGASRPEQIVENMKAVRNTSFSADELKQIDSILAG